MVSLSPASRATCAGRDLATPGLCYCCCLAHLQPQPCTQLICLENSFHSSESFLRHQLFRRPPLSSRWKALFLLDLSMSQALPSFLLPTSSSSSCSLPLSPSSCSTLPSTFHSLSPSCFSLSFSASFSLPSSFLSANKCD